MVAIRKSVAVFSINPAGETLTITGTEENPTVISGDEAIEGGGGIANLAGTVKIDHTIV